MLPALRPSSATRPIHNKCILKTGLETQEHMYRKAVTWAAWPGSAQHIWLSLSLSSTQELSALVQQTPLQELLEPATPAGVSIGVACRSIVYQSCSSEE